MGKAGGRHTIPTTSCHLNDRTKAFQGRGGQAPPRRGLGPHDRGRSSMRRLTKYAFTPSDEQAKLTGDPSRSRASAGDQGRVEQDEGFTAPRARFVRIERRRARRFTSSVPGRKSKFIGQFAPERKWAEGRHVRRAAPLLGAEIKCSSSASRETLDCRQCLLARDHNRCMFGRMKQATIGFASPESTRRRTIWTTAPSKSSNRRQTSSAAGDLTMANR